MIADTPCSRAHLVVIAQQQQANELQHRHGRGGDIRQGGGIQHLARTINFIASQKAALAELSHSAFAGVEFDRQGDQGEKYRSREQDDADIDQHLERKDESENEQRHGQHRAEIGDGIQVLPQLQG